MNERLYQQDFIDLLANKHGMNKKDADKFVREFFLLIEEALEKDKYVKIKGLGTFKLVDVESRESVNVNTGERFQIPGYTKVSFTPDNSLRDIINKPFAHFETVVLNESTVLEDTPVSSEFDDENEETVEEEITAQDVQESIQEETNNEATVPDQEVPIETAILPTEQAVLNEPVEMSVSPQRESVEPQASAEDIIAKELSESPVKAVPEVVADEKLPEQAIPEKVDRSEKSPIPYLITIIIVVLLLCGGALLYIYYPDLFESGNQPEQVEHKVNQPESVVPVIPRDTVVQEDTIAEVVPSVKQQTPIAPVKKEPDMVKKNDKPQVSNKEGKNVSKPAPFKPDSVGYIITGTKTTYTIKEGETLTKVALRFYGTKALWPYIVKHNPDIIKNPDNVPYGTTIKIPELVKK